MSVGYERQPCKTDKPIKMPFGCGLGHWGGGKEPPFRGLYLGTHRPAAVDILKLIRKEQQRATRRRGPWLPVL